MRILMLSWEYPPNNVGGLAQHVDDLTRFIAQKCEVHVVTVGSSEISLYERIHGVNVHRVVPYQLSHTSFIDWVLQLNVALLEKSLSIVVKKGASFFDIVHAHDWLVAYAARALKNLN